MAGREIPDLGAMKDAARAIRELGPQNIVIKGARLAGVAADLLYDGKEFTEFRADCFHSKYTHGTGCIFASAIAANLAHGRSVKESIAAAKEFITSAIRNGLAIGKGCGPANPMAALLHATTKGLNGNQRQRLLFTNDSFPPIFQRRDPDFASAGFRREIRIYALEDSSWVTENGQRACLRVQVLASSYRYST